MAGPPVTEFCIMNLQPDATIEEDGTAAHKTWREMIAYLKKTEGCNHVFFGRQVEHPSTGVLCVDWASFAAAKTYMASPALKPFLDMFKTLVESATLHHVALGPAANAVLEAPATEVFTAYGTEPGYLENTRRFVEKVEADMPAGCYGAVCGEVEQDIAKGEDGEKGRAVKLVVGWASVEAHAEAKGKPDGAISTNIHLLRSLRKDVDLYHVHFKEQ